MVLPAGFVDTMSCMHHIVTSL